MVLSLTYLSSAVDPFGPEDLRRLLLAVRTKNEELGITGVLLYSDGNFVQTLEGPGAAVKETFARISADPRHRGIVEAWREEIEQRAFPDWSMGFRELSADEAASLPGFNNYLSLIRRIDVRLRARVHRRGVPPDLPRRPATGLTRAQDGVEPPAIS